MTEPKKSIVGRWILLTLVTSAALWAWWGHRNDTRPYGMALGQDLRGGTTLRFALDLERARREGKITAGETDASVVEHTLAMI